MKEKTKGRKAASAVAAVTVAAAILLTGTFAWQSISQTALNVKTVEVNPGGRLHDDFDGNNKDVYVENFGDTPIFARVRLDEYMEIGAGAGLKTGDTDYESKAAKPVKVGTDINDMDTWVTHIPGATAEDDPFHQYIEWEMGGQTTYMPTFNKNKDSLKADINGTYEGTDPGDDVHYDDYHAYSPGEQKTDDAIYDADDNTVDENPGVENTNYTKQEEQHTAKVTLNSTVMTMEEWIEAGSQPGPYWVYDTDGWAYWAQAIEPDTATGLLLNGLTQLSVPDDDWYYGINVVGQFASMGDWGTAEGNDGFFGDDAGAKPTDNAVFLLNQAAGYKLKVTVSAADDATTVKLGGTLQMSAEVTIGGKKHANQEVKWSVFGRSDNTTNITSEGLLTMGNNERVGSTIEVRAVSTADDSTLGVYKITVESPWDTQGIGSITPGSMQVVTIDEYDWYVLAREGNNVLLFAKNIMENKSFSIQDSIPNWQWEGSGVQKYLNGEWLEKMPTINAHVVETEIKTRTDSTKETFINSTNKVFLLSEADVFGTFQNSPAKPNDFTYNGKILVNEKIRALTNPWCVRSPYRAAGADEDVVASVGTNGTVRNNEEGLKGPINIRPALWIDLAQ